ncbi:bifunctional diguanylate cyclase/phosphodiesterase [Pseudomonas baetica]|uniref:bifunctional diguanylate cyclase/phosphodiesterase n=1 Tax=Pseudomonas baetica TaxID=674054 RepID=UPI0024059F21|nr:EAL domain-containing protein [Pseudomonas baetica]MDF9773512.1 diguanylate cyclase (GGDEF)-like protein/PAS domain S-box-containing protein [Pseudomonas baetica]
MTDFYLFNTLKTPPGSSAVFARRTMVSFVALLLLVFTLATIILVRIARNQNDQALDQSLFFAEKALKIRQDNLRLSIGDYAFWGDAYQNLHSHVDLEWAYTRGNVGASLFEKFGYDGVFVVAPDNRTVYGVIEGQLQPIAIQQWLQGDVTQLLEEAKARAAEEQGVVKVFQVAGRPALVVAASLTPGSDPSVRKVPGAPSVLLFVDVLRPDKLLSLGQDYALKQLRVARNEDDAALGPSLRLPTVGGSSFLLRWDPAQPGSPLFSFMLPVLGIAGLTIGFLSWLVMRHAMATARLLDGSYASLVVSEARFQDIAQASSDWLWETDAQLRFSYLSGRFEEVTGYAPEAWLGRPLNDFLKFRAASLARWVASPEVQATPDTPLSCSYQSASGKYCLCNLVVCAISGPAGVHGYRGTARDITAEMEDQARIQQLQQYDALTGLPNRKHLQEQLEKRMKGVQNNSIAVLSISLERFKQVNDSLGRTVGDQVLVELSRRLESFLRTEDFLARHTGDEFIVLLDGGFSLQEYIAKLCKRLIECVERPFRVAQHQVFLSARIGIAIAPQDAESAHELLRSAEIALYRARHQKQSHWCFFTHEMDRQITEEKQLENDLRFAISNGELRLHFQPRYRTSDRHLSGVEALVRWQHPQRGLLSPGAFIPLAEQTGLVAPLGDWVLRQACFQAMSFPAPIFVSVNLSAKQFRAPDLVAQVQSILEESGLPATRLELEITESMMFDDAEGALATLDELKTLGIRLSMDDFGTGYSSLSYLHRYPFDILKIDRSFTARLDDAEDGLAVVLAIVWLGHALSMHVTAEGVESEEQLILLGSMGCDEVQGFHLSRPIPIELLCSLLEQTHTNVT